MTQFYKRYISIALFTGIALLTQGQTSVHLSSNAIAGTYIIDLRPTPESKPYLKEFKIEKIVGKKFDGEFYGYPFSGGFLNTDWEKVYFAFTTADQSGIYYHSGFKIGRAHV